jgi:hypothetical protein
MKKELVLGDVDFGLVREDNAVGALHQSIFKLWDVRSWRIKLLHSPYQRDDLGWLRCQLMRQLLVEADQVIDVDIAVVPL